MGETRYQMCMGPSGMYVDWLSDYEACLLFQSLSINSSFFQPRHRPQRRLCAGFSATHGERMNKMVHRWRGRGGRTMHETNMGRHQHPTPSPQSPRVRTGGKCKCAHRTVAYSQQEMGTPQQASSTRGSAVTPDGVCPETTHSLLWFWGENPGFHPR